MRSIYKKKVLNQKFSTNESKVKGLGSPLRAEPSGRCSQNIKFNYRF